MEKKYEVVRVIFERDTPSWFEEAQAEELILVELGRGEECAELIQKGWEEYKVLENQEDIDEDFEDNPVTFIEMYINDHATFEFKFVQYQLAHLKG